ncbi:MAG: nitrite reductase, partial [Bacteroidetes bacterium HGW-Bacteroidetes-13]
ILLGGGTLGNGEGRFSDKVIKVPSKRGPQALRLLLDDYDTNSNKNENYLAYYDRQGKNYFYELLKSLADTTVMTPEEFIDWGHDEAYVQAIGVGECAGVVIDLISTLLFESEEKIDLAKSAFDNSHFSDSIYHAYNASINTAKALLLSENVETNSQANIISLFDEHFTQTGKIKLPSSFADTIYQINKNEPTENFAQQYLAESISLLKIVQTYREKTQAHETVS